MAATIHTIPPLDLAIAFLPVIAVIGVMHLWSHNIRETVYGFARMVLQLSLIGYLLVYVFAAKAAWIVLAVLVVMVLASSWIALRATPETRKSQYLAVLASVVLGGGSVLVLITQFVLHATPWYNPTIIIPLAGMIFMASMNCVSLSAERLTAEMARGLSYEEARPVAFRTALIPNTNGLFAVGLVSLPGMMTGQILSGVSPMVAARYQMMVMCMMFAAAGLSAALFLTLRRGRETARH